MAELKLYNLEEMPSRRRGSTNVYWTQLLSVPGDKAAGWDFATREEAIAERRRLHSLAAYHKRPLQCVVEPIEGGFRLYARLLPSD